MKLVLTMVVDDVSADLLDAWLAYHLNAGVDLVVAAKESSDEHAREILERFSTDRLVAQVTSSTRTELAQLAVCEHGADWVIDARGDEFWWPRGESLKDVLVTIPPRYSIVQGLERVFLARPGSDFFAERMTIRPVQQQLGDERSERDDLPLRPVYRAAPRMTIGTTSGRVPLRAWYPIEVLRFPDRGGESATADEQTQNGLHDGALVVDERLRDALRTLRGSGAFEPPAEGRRGLVLGVPDVVDDAAYAVECAAVGEVDLARLDRHIRELEARIAFLEAKFWPRVLRTFSRLKGSAGRGSGPR